MTDHTPLRIHERVPGQWALAVDLPQYGTDGLIGQFSKEEAAFVGPAIVCYCNSHEKLLAACEAALVELDGQNIMGEDTHGDLCEQLDAAIAEAKETP